MGEPVFTEHWYALSQLQRLAALARSTANVEGAVIDLGCWQGASTIALARGVAPTVVHAVDHWLGGAHEPDVRALAAARDVYAEFVANLAVAGVTNVCIHKMDWAEFAARDCPKQVRFVHLDDGHDTETVRAQIRFFWARLVPGGILAGDDWGWDSVRTAVVQELPSVQAAGNFWWRVK